MRGHHGIPIRLADPWPAPNPVGLTKGFPTETMRTAVEVIRLAIDSNMSPRARLVEVVFRQESAYEIAVGTAFARLRRPVSSLSTGMRPRKYSSM